MQKGGNREKSRTGAGRLVWRVMMERSTDISRYSHARQTPAWKEKTGWKSFSKNGEHWFPCIIPRFFSCTLVLPATWYRKFALHIFTPTKSLNSGIYLRQRQAVDVLLVPQASRSRRHCESNTPSFLCVHTLFRPSTSCLVDYCSLVQQH